MQPPALVAQDQFATKKLRRRNTTYGNAAPRWVSEIRYTTPPPNHLHKKSEDCRHIHARMLHPPGSPVEPCFLPGRLARPPVFSRASLGAASGQILTPRAVAAGISARRADRGGCGGRIQTIIKRHARGACAMRARLCVPRVGKTAGDSKTPNRRFSRNRNRNQRAASAARGGRADPGAMRSISPLFT